VIKDSFKDLFFQWLGRSSRLEKMVSILTCGSFTKENSLEIGAKEFC
jgi:hypothetical protein